MAHKRDVDVMEIHIQFHFIHDVLSEEWEDYEKKEAAYKKYDPLIWN